MLNVALRHPTPREEANAGDENDHDEWNKPAPLEDLLEYMKDYSPLLTDLLKETTDPIVTMSLPIQRLRTTGEMSTKRQNMKDDTNSIPTSPGLRTRRRS